MKTLLTFSFFFILLTKTYCQLLNHKNLRIRYTFSYVFEPKPDDKFRVMHHIPVMTYRHNRNDFYIGPQFSHIFQPTPVANVIYENNSLGINFGYRYYSQELTKNLYLFGQFNFSLFKIKFEEYQKGSQNVKKRSEIIIENIASIGINYKIIKDFNFFVGFGGGSFNGFFLILDEFNLNTYIGMEYEF
jgi:hypothetical protein